MNKNNLTILNGFFVGMVILMYWQTLTLNQTAIHINDNIINLTEKVVNKSNVEQTTNHKSLHCMQEALYFEAANETIQGQMAIAQVIRRRISTKYYANNICNVVHQRKQFSYYHDGKSDIPDLTKSPNRKAWNNAKRVSEVYIDDDYMIDYDLQDATMYHADYVKPDWDWNQVIFIKKVDRHLFYKEKRVLKEIQI